MDVKRIIRERRLQEATEEIRRTQASAPHDSAQSQREFAARRVSRQVSARSSRPSSQFGDAESPPEWYQHEEGNHTQVYEPKSPAGMFGKNREIVSDVAEATEGGANGGIPTASSPHLTQRSNSQVPINTGIVTEQRKLSDNKIKTAPPAVLKLQKEIEMEREQRRRDREKERAIRKRVGVRSFSRTNVELLSGKSGPSLRKRRRCSS